MNYKDAYYYLFNRISDLYRELEEFQIEAEEICMGKDPEEQLEEGEIS